MAVFVGALPERKKRKLLHLVTASLNQTARLQAELEEGAGPHVLAARLKETALPDAVTVILRPTLAFLTADIALVVPGRVLVLNTLHWAGEVKTGEKGEWTGTRGVDLGRPDRRAALFAGRLAYSNLARGYQVEPAVVVTGGAVEYRGPDPEAPLVQWAALDRFLHERVPVGVAGFATGDLIRAMTPR